MMNRKENSDKNNGNNLFTSMIVWMRVVVRKLSIVGMRTIKLVGMRTIKLIKSI